MIGNALGDGKPKEGANDTKKEEELSFTEKYRKELKKDLSEIDLEEEEEDDTTEAASTEEEEAKEEPEADKVDDNAEEFVSSKDMFDEM